MKRQLVLGLLVALLAVLGGCAGRGGPAGGGVVSAWVRDEPTGGGEPKDYIVLFDTSASMNVPASPPLNFEEQRTPSTLQLVKESLLVAIREEWVKHPNNKPGNWSKVYFYCFDKEIYPHRGFLLDPRGQKQLERYIQRLPARGTESVIFDIVKKIRKHPEAPETLLQIGAPWEKEKRKGSRVFYLLTDGQDTTP